jgi:hypothetical protein
MSPKYRKHVSGDAEYAQGSWGGSWEPVEHGNIYIKIDDDVVRHFLGIEYIEMLTIPLALHRRQRD